MDLSRAVLFSFVYSRDLKIAAMRALDARSATDGRSPDLVGFSAAAQKKLLYT